MRQAGTQSNCRKPWKPAARVSLFTSASRDRTKSSRELTIVVEAAGIRSSSELGARDGEAGPSTWRGRRKSTEPSTASPGAGDHSTTQPSRSQSQSASRPTRMSFRLMEDINIPNDNAWITLPIRLAESQYDQQAYSSVYNDLGTWLSTMRLTTQWVWNGFCTRRTACPHFAGFCRFIRIGRYQFDQV